MRQAFTMVELIFVIVILGILAAVAIPRLSATRDDAQVVRMAQSVSQAISEIAAYATANGKVEDNFSQMSNHLELLQRGNEAVLTPLKATIKFGNVNDCLIIEVNSTASMEVLTMTFGADQNDLLCKPLQTMFNPQDYPIKLRGNTVTY